MVHVLSGYRILPDIYPSSSLLLVMGLMLLFISADIMWLVGSPLLFPVLLPLGFGLSLFCRLFRGLSLLSLIISSISPQAHWSLRICPWKIILIPNFPSNPSEFLVIFHPQDMDDGPSLLLNSALPGIFLYGVSLLEFPIDSSLPGTICLPSSPCLLYLLVSCPPWCFDRVSYSG